MQRRDLLQAMAAAGALSATASLTRNAVAAATPVEDTPVILECAVNGSTTKKTNPLAPETPAEITADIIAAFNAGATIVHCHSNKPNEDPQVAADAYVKILRPVWDKHPHAILYATANFDPVTYHRERRSWPGEIQSGHQTLLAEAGLVNMVLLDTGVIPIAGFDDRGVPAPASGFYWYGFWPDDVSLMLDTCEGLGTGASISVFEPGWMKNVLAMVRAGSIPRGSKLNIYFAWDSLGALAPPIPEALELYIKMMEGTDLKWAVGTIGGQSVMDTPLARMALERGGSLRFGMEDWPTGSSNVEQVERAKELVNAVGRPVVTGAEAIEYLDIPYPKTRP